MIREETYPKGTIKLVFVDPKNPKMLRSVMYPSKKTAISAAQGRKDKRWLLMELIEGKNNKYKWEVLPFGMHKEYMVQQKATNVSKSSPERVSIVLIALIGIGALTTLRWIVKKL